MKFQSLWILLVVVSCLCAYVFFRSAKSSVQSTSTMTGEGAGRAAAGPFRYRASAAERYVLRDSTRLGFEEANASLVPPSCAIWNWPNASTIYSDLHAYDDELDDYKKLVEQFKPLQKDVRQLILGSINSGNDACDMLEPVSGGLGRIFNKSGLLSRGSSFVFLEPILPPLRHPKFCESGHLLDWRYIVHDFAAFCRKITPSSKLVFVDLGASLSFHRPYKVPILDLIDEFYKFGFRFDHIYGFEITPTDPKHVVEALPDHIFASYHWINVGVSDDPLAKTNPWNMIMRNFREEDFVVVKLDIDTPVLEESLVHQLRNNPRISQLVDVLYFEHHVLLKELFPYWTTNMKSTVKESMDLFVQLRELGIASHPWI